MDRLRTDLDQFEVDYPLFNLHTITLYYYSCSSCWIWFGRRLKSRSNLPSNFPRSQLSQISLVQSVPINKVAIFRIYFPCSLPMLAEKPVNISAGRPSGASLNAPLLCPHFPTVLLCYWAWQRDYFMVGTWAFNFAFVGNVRVHCWHGNRRSAPLLINNY